MAIALLFNYFITKDPGNPAETRVMLRPIPDDR